MTQRRRTSFGPTVLAGLAAAALSTVAASRTWATATTTSPGVRTVTAEGSDVAPVALPLALVALAAWGTVLVLRVRGRRVVAVIGLLASAGAAVAAALLAGDAAEVAGRRLGDATGAATDTTAWPYVTVVAALLTAALFVVALVSAGRWPEMSSRYDAPAGRSDDAGERDGGVAAPTSERDLWQALDEGHDPTV